MRLKPFLLSILFLLIIIFLVGFIFWIISSQKIRKDTLSFLKENLEFCQIIKDKIFFSRGEFWLICNGRPFYAVYEDGKINYELNGWGFLKRQPQILAELQENKCNFYNFENNKLTFVCKDEKIRTYNFSLSNFYLQKEKEDLFINYLLKNPRYNCEFLSDFIFGFEGEDFLVINEKCRIKEEPQIYETKIAFNLDKLYFTLPTIVEKNLPNIEKAEKSFQLINFCKLDFVQEINPVETLLGMNCNIGKPEIVYNFELGTSNFLISESEFETLFPYLRRFIFPFFEARQCKFIKSQEDNENILKYYSCDQRMIVAKILKGSGIVSEVYLKNEGL